MSPEYFAAGIITTVAGSGDCSYSGDGGPALSAGIRPTSVAVDDSGNIYFVESSLCESGEVDPVSGECTGGTVSDSSFRLCKVSTDGLVHTIASTGQQARSWDDRYLQRGVPATEAPLFNPSSVSVGPEGNVYLADGSSILKINTSGVIGPVVGDCTGSGYFR